MVKAANASRSRSRMVAPKITFQQVFILAEIERGANHGKNIRDSLEREGMPQYSSTFSICMRRLKSAGLVTAKRVKGIRGDECIYSLTAAGRAALKEVRDFFQRVDRAE